MALQYSLDTRHFRALGRRFRLRPHTGALRAGELPHLARAKEFGYAEHAFRCIESAKAYAAAHISHARSGPAYGARDVVPKSVAGSVAGSLARSLAKSAA